MAGEHSETPEEGEVILIGVQVNEDVDIGEERTVETERERARVAVRTDLMENMVKGEDVRLLE